MFTACDGVESSARCNHPCTYQYRLKLSKDWHLGLKVKTAIWSVFVIGQGSTADMEMNTSNFCIYYTCHHLSDLKQMLNTDDIKTSKAIKRHQYIFTSSVIDRLWTTPALSPGFVNNDTSLIRPPINF